MVRSNSCPHRIVVLQNFVIFQIRYPETFRVVSGITCNGRRVSLGKNSGKNTNKYVSYTRKPSTNVFLLDENRSGQFSKIMSKSFRFNCLLCGCFRTFQLLEDYMHLDSWCNRTSFLPSFFFCDERKESFLWPNKKLFLFWYQFSCFESQNRYPELLELWFTYSIFTEPDSRFWRHKLTI